MPNPLHTICGIITLFTLCLTCHAADPKPLLVVSTYGAWGGGTPDAGSTSFTLYDDGTVICYHKPPYGEYREPEELFTTRKIAEPKKKIQELLAFDFPAAKTHYELTNATCQPVTIIWTPDKKIEIYGDWKNPRRFEPGMEKDPKYADLIKRETDLWKTFPDEIRQALLRIEKEIPVSGKSWLPETIELRFTAYEYARDKSINWPANWPSLKDKSTQKHSETSYSVYLPIQKLPEWEAFRSTRERNGAILIDGRKMDATHRFPFPNEDLWRSAPLESFQ